MAKVVIPWLPVGAGALFMWALDKFGPSDLSWAPYVWAGIAAFSIVTLITRPFVAKPLAVWRRKAPTMSFLIVFLLSGAVCSLVFLITAQQDSAAMEDRAVPVSGEIERERRLLYADFMKLVDESWNEGLRRQSGLHERLASLQHTMNLIGPLIPSTRVEWNNTLQDFKVFVQLTGKDPQTRTDDLMADRVKEFSMYRVNFQNGLYFALFGGAPFRRVTKDEVVLSTHEEPVNSPGTSTFDGDIVWRFDVADEPPVLGLASSHGEEPYVYLLQFYGRNNSGERLEQIGGYVQSGSTDTRVKVGLNVDGTILEPEKTSGIPPGAEFAVMTWPLPSNATQRTGGLGVSRFLVDFARFTFVFRYNGKTFTREFTNKEIVGQIERFNRTLAEQAAQQKPRVTKKLPPQ